jgi:hypothetical protein
MNAVIIIPRGTTFYCPDEIRKIIYTTNAIESLNSVIRKAIKNRRIFPNDESTFKIIYLAVQQASRKWAMPLRNWKPAMNRFLLEYGDRFLNERKSQFHRNLYRLDFLRIPNYQRPAFPVSSLKVLA